MKSFKKFLKESQFYSITPDGNKINNKLKSINFHLSELQKSRGYSNIIEVSDLFHSKYKQSKNYVSMTGKKDSIANKRIRDLMKNESELEYPEVNVDENGNINFVNGAHRFAMMNRLGLKRQICLRDSCLKNAMKYNYKK